MNARARPLDLGDATDLVVGVDGSDGADAALRWAFATAAARGGRVHAVLVHDASADPVAAARLLRDSVAGGPVPPGVRVTETVIVGRPVSALSAAAATAAMLVVGSHGHGPLGLHLPGSVSRGCAQHGPTPTIVVRGGPGPPAGSSRPVVVGIDGSPAAVVALRWAATQARLRGVPLLVVHAWSPPYRSEAVAREVLDQAVSQDLAGFSDIEVHARLAVDTPLRGLLEAARDAQLLVVGHRGIGGFEGMLLGSVSRACVLSSPCTVAVIHGARREKAAEPLAVRAAERAVRPAGVPEAATGS